MAALRLWPVKRGNHGQRVICDPKLFLALCNNLFQPMNRRFGGGMGRKTTACFPSPVRADVYDGAAAGLGHCRGDGLDREEQMA